VGIRDCKKIRAWKKLVQTGHSAPWIWLNSGASGEFQQSSIQPLYVWTAGSVNKANIQILFRWQDGISKIKQFFEFPFVWPIGSVIAPTIVNGRENAMRYAVAFRGHSGQWRDIGLATDSGPSNIVLVHDRKSISNVNL
jgi:hypothetical protein